MTIKYITKWEYKILNSNNQSLLTREAEMNKLGQEGWELVAVRADSNFVYSYFKRWIKEYED
jgi:hypothetical protein